MSALTSLLTHPGTITAGALLGSAMTGALLYAYFDRKALKKRRNALLVEKVEALARAAIADAHQNAVDDGSADENRSSMSETTRRDAMRHLSSVVKPKSKSGDVAADKEQSSWSGDSDTFLHLDPPLPRNFQIQIGLLGHEVVINAPEGSRLLEGFAGFHKLPDGGEVAQYDGRVYGLRSAPGGHFVWPGVTEQSSAARCYWVSSKGDLVTRVEPHEAEKFTPSIMAAASQFL